MQEKIHTHIIDGKKIQEGILTEVREGIKTLSFVPIFCDVVVGDDPVSLQYVRMKSKAASDIGIECMYASFPESITTDALVEEIKKLNQIPRMSGLIVQLPLPAHIDRQAVLDAIDPAIDVDCLGVNNSMAFYNDDCLLMYPTALACLVVLDSLNLDLSSKRFVVLGQGELVGRPVAHLLYDRALLVDVVTRTTPDAATLIKNADVVISGIGDGHFIKGSMIKNGALIIDAGTSEMTGAVAGDVDSATVEGVAGYLSPVPGGVGPVTVALLLRNVLIAASNKNI